jgi:hypothetical protein
MIVDRRSFFFKSISYLQNICKKVVFSSDPDPGRNNSGKEYFDSVLTCYPLLSETSYEDLVVAAKNLGISTNNKSKLELAREIFGKEAGK